MLNENIIKDLKAKARRSEPGLEDHPDYRPPATLASESLNVFTITAGINDLKRTVHKCAVDHGWWETDRNFGELIALMHSELSEALEAWREDDDITKISHEGICDPHLGKPIGVASEFADVIIRILDTCEHLDIPITEALIEKHKYNSTRPYRHGNKRA